MTGTAGKGPRRIRTALLAMGCVLASFVAVPVASVDTADGQASPPPCQSTTYAYTGGMVQCTVPPGVTRIGVRAVGGQGSGTRDHVLGGLGGVTNATISVTPGEVLDLYVGGSGDAGGFGGANGGASGDAEYFSSADGGDGGGSSEVRNAAGTRLVVAGGGGGGGGGSYIPAGGGVGGEGGAGGVYFGPDSTFAAPGAHASGYQDNGGAPGCGGCVSGSGTNGGDSSRGDGGGGGGGGGGGYLSGSGGQGGGFGGGGGGGGGGLSYADPSTTDVSYGIAPNTGNGSITLHLSPVGLGRPKGRPAPPVPTDDPVVFATPGVYAWKVPNDVTALTITAAGGAGGIDHGESQQYGTLGDMITATVSVTPGSTLSVIVGEVGGNGGGTGYGVGGDNGSTCGPCKGDDGSGGGGSSAVLAGTTPLVVAGGGGGYGGDADGGSAGGKGGLAGISPQGGYFSEDPLENSVYGWGGAGGTQSTLDGGKGGDCSDPLDGAGGGGGGGYWLANLGGGGAGGGTACNAATPPGDPEGSFGGGGAGGGGGRSFLDFGARHVSFGGSKYPLNGAVILTPVVGGALTVTQGNGLKGYPGGTFGTLTVQATDLFGDPIPNVPVKFQAPSGIAHFDCDDGASTCVVTTNEHGNASVVLEANVPPWVQGTFSVQASSLYFPTVEVTGLEAHLLPTTVSVTSSTPDHHSSEGEAVVFSAAVSVAGNPYAPLQNPYPIPNGFVQFVIDGTPYGPNAGVDRDTGVATSRPISNLTNGPHTIVAQYLGDDDHQLWQPSEGSTTQTVGASLEAPPWAEAPGASGGAGGSRASGGSGGRLAFTGSTVVPAGLGLLLVALGVAAVAFGRRRPRSERTRSRG